MQTPINRRHFTKQEDMQIRKLVSFNGFNWDLISSFLPGHTPRQIRDRYVNCLIPIQSVRHQWTLEEDIKLTELYQKYGPKWTMISNFFIGRTPNSIKNRWNTYVSKQFKSYTLKNIENSQFLENNNSIQNNDQKEPLLLTTNNGNDLLFDFDDSFADILDQPQAWSFEIPIMQI